MKEYRSSVPGLLLYINFIVNGGLTQYVSSSCPNRYTPETYEVQRIWLQPQPRFLSVTPRPQPSYLGLTSRPQTSVYTPASQWSSTRINLAHGGFPTPFLRPFIQSASYVATPQPNVCTKYPITPSFVTPGVLTSTVFPGPVVTPILPPPMVTTLPLPPAAISTTTPGAITSPAVFQGLVAAPILSPPMVTTVPLPPAPIVTSSSTTPGVITPSAVFPGSVVAPMLSPPMVTAVPLSSTPIVTSSCDTPVVTTPSAVFTGPVIAPVSSAATVTIPSVPGLSKALNTPTELASGQTTNVSLKMLSPSIIDRVSKPTGNVDVCEASVSSKIPNNISSTSTTSKPEAFKSKETFKEAGSSLQAPLTNKSSDSNLSSTLNVALINNNLLSDSTEKLKSSNSAKSPELLTVKSVKLSDSSVVSKALKDASALNSNNIQSKSKVAADKIRNVQEAIDGDIETKCIKSNALLKPHNYVYPNTPKPKAKHIHACLAGYDGEIFDIIREIKTTTGDEIEVHFYLYHKCRFNHLSSHMTTIKALQEKLSKYHHYICLEKKYVESYDAKKDCWYIEKLIIIPSFNSDLDVLNSNIKINDFNNICTKTKETSFQPLALEIEEKVQAKNAQEINKLIEEEKAKEISLGDLKKNYEKGLKDDQLPTTSYSDNKKDNYNYIHNNDDDKESITLTGEDIRIPDGKGYFLGSDPALNQKVSVVTSNLLPNNDLMKNVDLYNINYSDMTGEEVKIPNFEYYNQNNIEMTPSNAGMHGYKIEESEPKTNLNKYDIPGHAIQNTFNGVSADEVSFHNTGTANNVPEANKYTIYSNVNVQKTHEKPYWFWHWNLPQQHYQISGQLQNINTVNGVRNVPDAYSLYPISTNSPSTDIFSSAVQDKLAFSDASIVPYTTHKDEPGLLSNISYTTDDDSSDNNVLPKVEMDKVNNVNYAFDNLDPSRIVSMPSTSAEKLEDQYLSGRIIPIKETLPLNTLQTITEPTSHTYTQATIFPEIDTSFDLPNIIEGNYNFVPVKHKEQSPESVYTISELEKLKKSLPLPPLEVNVVPEEIVNAGDGKILNPLTTNPNWYEHNNFRTSEVDSIGPPHSQILNGEKIKTTHSFIPHSPANIDVAPKKRTKPNFPTEFLTPIQSYGKILEDATFKTQNPIFLTSQNLPHNLQKINANENNANIKTAEDNVLPYTLPQGAVSDTSITLNGITISPCEAYEEPVDNNVNIQQMNLLTENYKEFIPPSAPIEVKGKYIYDEERTITNSDNNELITKATPELNTLNYYELNTPDQRKKEIHKLEKVEAYDLLSENNDRHITLDDAVKGQNIIQPILYNSKEYISTENKVPEYSVLSPNTNHWKINVLPNESNKNNRLVNTYTSTNPGFTPKYDILNSNSKYDSIPSYASSVTQPKIPNETAKLDVVNGIYDSTPAQKVSQENINHEIANQIPLNQISQGEIVIQQKQPIVSDRHESYSTPIEVTNDNINNVVEVKPESVLNPEIIPVSATSNYTPNNAHAAEDSTVVSYTKPDVQTIGSSIKPISDNKITIDQGSWSIIPDKVDALSDVQLSNVSPGSTKPDSVALDNGPIISSQKEEESKLSSHTPINKYYASHDKLSNLPRIPNVRNTYKSVPHMDYDIEMTNIKPKKVENQQFETVSSYAIPEMKTVDSHYMTLSNQPKDLKEKFISCSTKPYNEENKYYQVPTLPTLQAKETTLIPEIPTLKVIQPRYTNVSLNLPLEMINIETILEAENISDEFGVKTNEIKPEFFEHISNIPTKDFDITQGFKERGSNNDIIKFYTPQTLHANGIPLRVNEARTETKPSYFYEDTRPQIDEETRNWPKQQYVRVLSSHARLKPADDKYRSLFANTIDELKENVEPKGLSEKEQSGVIETYSKPVAKPVYGTYVSNVPYQKIPLEKYYKNNRGSVLPIQNVVPFTKVPEVFIKAIYSEPEQNGKPNYESTQYKLAANVVLPDSVTSNPQYTEYLPEERGYDYTNAKLVTPQKDAEGIPVKYSTKPAAPEHETFYNKIPFTSRYQEFIGTDKSLPEVKELPQKKTSNDKTLNAVTPNYQFVTVENDKAPVTPIQNLVPFSEAPEVFTKVIYAKPDLYGKPNYESIPDKLATNVVSSMNMKGVDDNVIKSNEKQENTKPTIAISQKYISPTYDSSSVMYSSNAGKSNVDYFDPKSQPAKNLNVKYESQNLITPRSDKTHVTPTFSDQLKYDILTSYNKPVNLKYYTNMPKALSQIKDTQPVVLPTTFSNTIESTPKITISEKDEEFKKVMFYYSPNDIIQNLNKEAFKKPEYLSSSSNLPSVFQNEDKFNVIGAYTKPDKPFILERMQDHNTMTPTDTISSNMLLINASPNYILSQDITSPITNAEPLLSKYEELKPVNGKYVDNKQTPKYVHTIKTYTMAPDDLVKVKHTLNQKTPAKDILNNYDILTSVGLKPSNMQIISNSEPNYVTCQEIPRPTKNEESLLTKYDEPFNGKGFYNTETPEIKEITYTRPDNIVKAKYTVDQSTLVNDISQNYDTIASIGPLSLNIQSISNAKPNYVGQEVPRPTTYYAEPILTKYEELKPVNGKYMQNTQTPGANPVTTYTRPDNIIKTKYIVDRSTPPKDTSQNYDSITPIGLTSSNMQPISNALTNYIMVKEIPRPTTHAESILTKYEELKPVNGKYMRNTQTPEVKPVTTYTTPDIIKAKYIVDQSAPPKDTSQNYDFKTPIGLTLSKLQSMSNAPTNYIMVKEIPRPTTDTEPLLTKYEELKPVNGKYMRNTQTPEVKPVTTYTGPDDIIGAKYRVDQLTPPKDISQNYDSITTIGLTSSYMQPISKAQANYVMGQEIPRPTTDAEPLLTKYDELKPVNGKYMHNTQTPEVQPVTTYIGPDDIIKARYIVNQSTPPKDISQNYDSITPIGSTSSNLQPISNTPKKFVTINEIPKPTTDPEYVEFKPFNGECVYKTLTPEVEQIITYTKPDDIIKAKYVLGQELPSPATNSEPLMAKYEEFKSINGKYVDNTQAPEITPLTPYTRPDDIIKAKYIVDESTPQKDISQNYDSITPIGLTLPNMQPKSNALTNYVMYKELPRPSTYAEPILTKYEELKPVYGKYMHNTQTPEVQPVITNIRPGDIVKVKYLVDQTTPVKDIIPQTCDTITPIDSIPSNMQLISNTPTKYIIGQENPTSKANAEPLLTKYEDIKHINGKYLYNTLTPNFNPTTTYTRPEDIIRAKYLDDPLIPPNDILQKYDPITSNVPLVNTIKNKYINPLKGAYESINQPTIPEFNVIKAYSKPENYVYAKYNKVNPTYIEPCDDQIKFVNYDFKTQQHNTQVIPEIRVVPKDLQIEDNTKLQYSTVPMGSAETTVKPSQTYDSHVANTALKLDTITSYTKPEAKPQYMNAVLTPETPQNNKKIVSETEFPIDNDKSKSEGQLTPLVDSRVVPDFDKITFVHPIIPINTIKQNYATGLTPVSSKQFIPKIHSSLIVNPKFHNQIDGVAAKPIEQYYNVNVVKFAPQKKEVFKVIPSYSEPIKFVKGYPIVTPKLSQVVAPNYETIISEENLFKDATSYNEPDKTVYPNDTPDMVSLAPPYYKTITLNDEDLLGPASTYLKQPVEILKPNPNKLVKTVKPYTQESAQTVTPNNQTITSNNQNLFSPASSYMQPVKPDQNLHKIHPNYRKPVGITSFYPKPVESLKPYVERLQFAPQRKEDFKVTSSYTEPIKFLKGYPILSPKLAQVIVPNHNIIMSNESPIKVASSYNEPVKTVYPNYTPELAPIDTPKYTTITSNDQNLFDRASFYIQPVEIVKPDGQKFSPQKKDAVEKNPFDTEPIKFVKGYPILTPSLKLDQVASPNYETLMSNESPNRVPLLYNEPVKTVSPNYTPELVLEDTPNYRTIPSKDQTLLGAASPSIQPVEILKPNPNEPVSNVYPNYTPKLALIETTNYKTMTSNDQNLLGAIQPEEILKPNVEELKYASHKKETFKVIPSYTEPIKFVKGYPILTPTPKPAEVVVPNYETIMSNENPIKFASSYNEPDKNVCHNYVTELSSTVTPNYNTIMSNDQNLLEAASSNLQPIEILKPKPSKIIETVTPKYKNVISNYQSLLGPVSSIQPLEKLKPDPNELGETVYPYYTPKLATTYATNYKTITPNLFDPAVTYKQPAEIVKPYPNSSKMFSNYQTPFGITSSEPVEDAKLNVEELKALSQRKETFEEIPSYTEPIKFVKGHPILTPAQKLDQVVAPHYETIMSNENPINVAYSYNKPVKTVHPNYTPVMAPIDTPNYKTITSNDQNIIGPVSYSKQLIDTLKVYPNEPIKNVYPNYVPELVSTVTPNYKTMVSNDQKLLEAASPSIQPVKIVKPDPYKPFETVYSNYTPKLAPTVTPNYKTITPNLFSPASSYIQPVEIEKPDPNLFKMVPKYLKPFGITSSYPEPVKSSKSNLMPINTPILAETPNYGVKLDHIPEKIASGNIINQNSEYIQPDVTETQSNRNENVQHYNPNDFYNNVCFKTEKDNTTFDELRNCIFKTISSSPVLQQNLHDIKSPEEIALKPITIAKMVVDDSNSKIIKTSDINIDLKSVVIKMKVLRPKLVFESEELMVTNFIPIVNYNEKRDQDTIQDIAKQIVEKSYSEPVILKDEFSKSNPYVTIREEIQNHHDGKAFIWPAVYKCDRWYKEPNGSD